MCKSLLSRPSSRGFIPTSLSQASGSLSKCQRGTWKEGHLVTQHWPYTLEHEWLCVRPSASRKEGSARGSRGRDPRQSRVEVARPDGRRWLAQVFSKLTHWGPLLARRPPCTKADDLTLRHLCLALIYSIPPFKYHIYVLT